MQPASPDRNEEQDLVRRCLAGQADAIQALIDQFQGIVFGLCLRMVRQREDAEDLTQETLVRTVRALKNWDSTKQLKPWILAIAANRCRTHLSRMVKRPVSHEMTLELPDHRRNKEEELSDELQLALDQLRPHYRLAVVMFHEQDLAYEEISEIMEKPIGTIKTWIHRARLELAQILVRRGIWQQSPGSSPART